jgi:hypothetical protein
MSQMDRLSVLSCVTGLALLAVFFISAWLGAPRPEWLPMAIASIAGFELFMLVDALRNRKRGGA